MSEPTLTNPMGDGPPAAEPTGAFAGFIADANTGAFKAGHADGLPDDLKPYGPTLAKYGTFGDLLKEHHTLLSKGDGGVRIPGEGATPAEISAWRKAIGAGEKPEDYQLPKDHESIAKFAAEHGLTKAQASKLVEMRTKEAEDSKKAKDEGSMNNRLELAKQLNKAFGPQSADAEVGKATDVSQLFGITQADFVKIAELDPELSMKLIQGYRKLHPYFSESESMRSNLGTPGIASESTNPSSVIQSVVAGTHPRSEAWRKGDPATIEWMRELYKSKHR